MKIDMRNSLLTQVSTALDVTRLMSVFAVVLAVIATMGSKQVESAEPLLQNSSVTPLPPLLNELMIGCTQDGAINYLLQNGGYRIELVDGGRENHPPESPDQYDEAYVIRLGSRSDDTWSAEKLCLYFRDGYLAYKCIVPDESVDPNEVFHREIASGLQHPPSYPGLMDKVRWGKSTEPQIEQIPVDVSDVQDASSSDPTQQADLPRIRCGIAIGDLPPYATEHRYNVLVIYQNAGPTVMNDRMILPGFGVDPGILVTAKYIDHEETNGFRGNFGISGVRLYPGYENQTVTPMRRTAFRLEPGEATYMWFHVPDLQAAISVQAHVAGLCGDVEVEDQIRRHWDAESPKVATSNPIRMCSSPVADE